MAIRQVMVVAAAFGMAFVPLGAPQGSLPPLPHQVPACLESPSSPPAGHPANPQEVFPDPATPSGTAPNAVTGAIGDLTSKLPGFGGIWVDDAGLTHLAVQPEHATAIITVLGGQFNDEYVVVPVAHSYNDLVSRRDAITAQFESLRLKGLNLMEWGPDEVRNTVWISLIGYTEAKADLARKILGNDVVVKPAMTDGGVGDLFSMTDGGSHR